MLNVFLQPRIVLTHNLKANHLGREFTFSSENIETIRKELRTVREKFFDVGEVSELMRSMVIVTYGDRDWTKTGLWTLSENILGSYEKTLVTNTL